MISFSVVLLLLTCCAVCYFIVIISVVWSDSCDLNYACLITVDVGVYSSCFLKDFRPAECCVFIFRWVTNKNKIVDCWFTQTSPDGSTSGRVCETEAWFLKLIQGRHFELRNAAADELDRVLHLLVCHCLQPHYVSQYQRTIDRKNDTHILEGLSKKHDMQQVRGIFLSNIV